MPFKHVILMHFKLVLEYFTRLMSIRVKLPFKELGTYGIKKGPVSIYRKQRRIQNLLATNQLLQYYNIHLERTS